MHKNTKAIINRILELISEIESYEFYKKSLIGTTDKLYNEYQEGKYSYEEYKKLLQSVLKGKSKKDWVSYYNSYIYSLLKQIEPLFSQIIYTLYRDKSADNLRMAAAKPKEKAKIELEEHKGAVPEEEYEFVEIKRPSIVSKLRDAIASKEIHPKIEETAEESIKAKAKKRRLTEEEIEKRKTSLSSMIESIRSKKLEKELPNAAMPPRPPLLRRLSNYLFFRDIEKRKKSIKQKIERAREPSLFSRILGIFSSRPAKAEKAKPVKPSKEPLFSRIHMPLISGPSRPPVKEGYHRKEELPPLLHPKSAVREFFARTSLKIRIALLRILPPKKAPEPMPIPPKRRRMFLDALKAAVTPEKKKEPGIVLKPEEDRALKKLVEHVDRINSEISTLKVSGPARSLNIRMKLMFIRLHFFMRSIFERREAVRGYAAKAERPVPPPAKIEMPIKAPVPEAAKRPGILNAIAGNAMRVSGGIAAALRNSYYAYKGKIVFRQVEKPERFAPKEKKEEIPVIKARPEAPVIEEKPRVRIASSIIAPIRAWYRRLAEEERRFVAKKTMVPHSMQVEALRKKIIPIFEEEKISPTLLTEEVDKIKGIMEGKKRFEVYQPSYFGSISNTLVRRFTFYLIDRFPSLFKSLYDQLRFANIKVLSNTYVNIMMFSVILTFIGSMALFSFFFLAVGNPFFIILPKALMMGLVMSVVMFILFYMYPSIKAKTREKSINTNLPFAINHVAAVAGSGVPPTKMFKLLVESEEYGEVAAELGKVVEYTELFGYDLLTAIRSVSLTVPSAALKEFLEGIVSTVESGSEIKDYLRQKASEAMLAYELERQKYLETISTYSDVYTGILIAAPLFFIVALSLVSMLGGTIGGLEINVLIVFGAYVVIPVLNVLFIIFIELTQPEV